MESVSASDSDHSTVVIVYGATMIAPIKSVETNTALHHDFDSVRLSCFFDENIESSLVYIRGYSTPRCEYCYSPCREGVFAFYPRYEKLS